MNESSSYKSDLRILRIEISDPSESKVQKITLLVSNNNLFSIFSLAFPRGIPRDVTMGEDAAAGLLFSILQGVLSTTGPL